MMSRITALAIILVVCCLSCRLVRADLPPEPTVKELCEGSDIVLSATLVKATPDVQVDRAQSYRFATFRVDRVYKGQASLPRSAGGRTRALSMWRWSPVVLITR